MFLCFVLGFWCLASVVVCKTANIPSSSVDDDFDVFLPHEKWSDNTDWQLFKAFSTYPYQNVLISPISLKLVLALLYEGAGGKTEEEFQTALQFSANKTLVREHFANISKALQSPSKEYELNLGSRIFLDSQITPQQKYAAHALHNYNTEIDPTNFTEPMQASDKINQWVKNMTKGRVSELVRPGDLHQVVMLIANAIYFKGTWLHQFPKNRTQWSGFYVNSKTVVNVPYMTNTEKYYFFESTDLDAKILRLPYKGNRYSLFILLPNSRGGLPHLMNKITLAKFMEMLYMMDKATVQVILPKFKFNFQAKYTKILQDLGFRLMFQDTASFPGIARKQSDTFVRLVVSDILQKSGIELDEEGSVVFSATDIQLGNKFGEADNVFNATHPFMFFVAEQDTGSILFMGKVGNPLEVEPVLLPPRFGEDNESSAPANPAVQVQPLSTNNVVNLQPENEDQAAIKKRFNYFDLDLLKEFSETQGNVFISPASIKTTLALILEGARGKCAEEIGDALRINNIDSKETTEILSRLLFDLNDKTSTTHLEAGNAVFVSDKYKIIPEYQNKLSTRYKAQVKNVNFSNSSEAASVINSWVSNVTHGLIQQIVDNIFADTSIVIANALYFKGKWKYAFDVTNTKPKCFYSTGDRCVENTPMMQIAETFNFNTIAELGAHVIELPYEGDKYAMLIILPSGGNNIRVLARDLPHHQFSGIVDKLKPTELVLEIPRFEVDYTTELISYLIPLKIQEIFGERANLTGIIPNENIRINNIIHKTRVEVDEEGTKAAAATGAIVIPLMSSTGQKIVVDRPFIFFIYHKETRNIIFEGILMEPFQTSNIFTPPAPTAAPTNNVQSTQPVVQKPAVPAAPTAERLLSQRRTSALQYPSWSGY